MRHINERALVIMKCIICIYLKYKEFKKRIRKDVAATGLDLNYVYCGPNKDEQY